MSNDVLTIDAKLTLKGIDIFVDKKRFSVAYPSAIWKQVPLAVKQFMRDNLAYAETHLLPVQLEKSRIEYKTTYPFFESLFYRNQLFDMMFCELTDGVPQFTYLNPFYNLDIHFASRATYIPSFSPPKKIKQAVTTILPFTLGKESLATTGLCRELGINPILIFCQEPSQEYEEKKKLHFLRKFKRSLDTDFHFITHEPGLFRYGKAFNLSFASELGWGTQTTLLTLLVIPFVLFYRAQYVLIGSEHSNNYYDLINGWKVHCSFDQTTQWTPQQSMITQYLTGNHTRVHSMLEPMEELSIFYMLHHRYPQYSGYQFSCFAMKNLVGNSQWCHSCSKCFKNYLFALAAGVKPEILGFKRSMLTEKLVEQFYIPLRQDEELDLDFAFKIILKKHDARSLSKKSISSIQKKLRDWNYYVEYFFHLKSSYNLPDAYRNAIVSILKKELQSFKQLVS